jgi:septum formation protein
MKLLLASRSMARRAMLEKAGVPFEPVESGADEEHEKGIRQEMRPAALADHLAEAKAAGAMAGNALVLGADQVLERDDGSMLNKPRSRSEALEQLVSLCGRTHMLHSAAAVVEEGRCVFRARETVHMAMRTPSRAFLESYLDREYEAVRWNVGAYRIEGLGAQLFSAIEGSHFAILGLPLLPLLGYLRERGVIAD